MQPPWLEQPAEQPDPFSDSPNGVPDDSEAGNTLSSPKPGGNPAQGAHEEPLEEQGCLLGSGPPEQACRPCCDPPPTHTQKATSTIC